jgi:hypothetical protein
MIYVCNVGAPILPSWIGISLSFQKQPNKIPPAFPSQLFGSIRLESKCDPLDYFMKEVHIIWALMGEAHI